MHKPIFAFAIALWLLAGCGGEITAEEPSLLERAEQERQRLEDYVQGRAMTAPGGPTQEWEAQQPPAQGPAVVLRGTELTYNGKQVKLKSGVSLQEWIDIIGEKPREWLLYYPSGGVRHTGVYHFDKTGISIGLDDEKKKTFGLKLQFNIIPPEPYTTEDPSMYPKNVFKGYVDINGIIVNSKSTVNGINAALRKNRSLNTLYCHRRTDVCRSITTVKKPTVVYISADLGWSYHQYTDPVNIFGVSVYDEEPNP